MRNTQLKPQWQSFVDEYLICGVGRTAAIRAGYSPKSAHTQANKLLRRPEIQSNIQRRLDAKTMKADEVLERLTAIARFDLCEFITPSGTVDLEMLKNSEFSFVLKKVKDTPYGKDIEFHDSFAALDRLGKYHKLFVDRVDISAAIEQQIEIRAVDYRTAIAPLAPEPMNASLAASETEPQWEGHRDCQY